MERPYKISKKLASYQIQGLFKNFIQFWPNSRTFKALKMNQFFSRIFKDVGALLFSTSTQTLRQNNQILHVHKDNYLDQSTSTIEIILDLIYWFPAYIRPPTCQITPTFNLKYRQKLTTESFHFSFYYDYGIFPFFLFLLLHLSKI